MKKWLDHLQPLFFFRQTDRWLTVLRVGLGVEIVFYSLSLRDDWNSLFARTGPELIGPEFSEALLSIQSPAVPRLGWLITLGDKIGLQESTVLSLIWWLLVFAGVGLIAGFWSRISAILAWFVHLCVAKSAGLIAYGVDNFTTIGLFYLMLSPLPDHCSIDWLWRKAHQDPQLLGFWRRVLQIHLCLIYFFGGIAKCLGIGWWNGSNIWRALIRPPFNLIDPHTLVHYKSILPVAGMATVLLEMSYPIFIWPRRTRVVWLISICAMHFGIGMMMGMYLFAFVMILLNVAAFGPDIRRAPRETTKDFRSPESLASASQN